MKKALTLLSLSALVFAGYAQETKTIYQTIFRENDLGELIEDSILMIEGTDIRVEHSFGKEIYYDQDNNQVTKDGKYLLIYREDEYGNMVEDSIPK